MPLSSDPTQSDFDRIEKYSVAIEVIERLDDDIVGVHFSQRRFPVTLMRGRNHRSDALVGNNRSRSGNGLLDQRRTAIQRAKLFRDCVSAPVAGETAQACPLPGCQYNRPNVTLCTATVHEFLSPPLVRSERCY